MKKNAGLLILGLMASLTGWGQSKEYHVWNVGVRVGEPFTANFRSYLSDRKAIDVNVGLNGGLLGTRRNYGSKGQYRRPGLTINASSITHFGLNNEGNLRAYYGLGGQVNSRRNYPDRLAGNFEKKLSLGPTGTIGAEYIQLGSPYSFFGEAGLYLEALPRPLFAQFQLGLGVRFKIL